jgi:hypothetical protein
MYASGKSDDSSVGLELAVFNIICRGFTGPLNYYRNCDRLWEQSVFLKGPATKQFIAGASDPSDELSVSNYEKLENDLPNLRKKVLVWRVTALRRNSRKG